MALDKRANTLANKIASTLAKASPTGTVTVKAGDYEIELTGEALDALIFLADRRGQSFGEVLAEAIAVRKAIADARAQGRKVIIEPGDASPRELVLA